MASTHKLGISPVTRPARPSPEPPGAAAEGANAFKRFCTPSLSSRRTPDHAELVERARYHLRGAAWRRLETSVGELQTYAFMPDSKPIASVLLVHGWTAEAAFLGAFADFLRRRGFRAVLLDLPAHGQSEGTETSLVECGRAVLDVAEALGPFQFALGHSIGAMAAAMAGEGHAPLPRAYPFEAYVLIAMPNEFSRVTAEFGEELGLSPAAQLDFEARLEALAHREIDAFTGAGLIRATRRPTLLMHARDDADVAFDCAIEMAKACGNAKLVTFDGLGHRAILYAPPVVRAAAAFLRERVGR